MNSATEQRSFDSAREGKAQDNSDAYPSRLAACVCDDNVRKEAGRELRGYSTQSAMKMLVSCSARPLRLEAQTSFLPSDENMGKASKPG